MSEAVKREAPGGNPAFRSPTKIINASAIVAASGTELQGRAIADRACEDLRTLVRAAADALADGTIRPLLETLRARIALTRHPDGMTGALAYDYARQFGAPVHMTLAAMALLLDRPLEQLAGDAGGAVAETAATPGARDRARRDAAHRARSLAPEVSTSAIHLDQLVKAGPGGALARNVAALLDPRVGARDPARLRAWERTEIAQGFDPQLVDQALALLAQIRTVPQIRLEWERWRSQLPDGPARRASAPPGPPGARRPAHGEHTLGETTRRLHAAREIPVPTPIAVSWPVIRDPHAEPDGDGVWRFEDLLGTLECSVKPSVRLLRHVLALCLLLREADHVQNPGGEGRRTVITSYNQLNHAACGRACQGEEYEAWDHTLGELESARIALRQRAGAKGTDRSWSGSPIEAVWMLRPGGDVIPLRDWLALPEEDRDRRGRGGSAPSLLITFAENFYRGVMTRSEHRLVSKPVVWAARGELVSLVRVEAHTGVRRGQDTWEAFTAAPMLATFGYHGGDRRRQELLLEDDLHALREAWEPLERVSLGDARNGCGWITAHINRRGGIGLRAEFVARRTRTRAERSAAWAHERPGRVGRRRTFATAGSPGRARARAQSAAAALTGRPQLSSRRRRAKRVRGGVQGDLDAAARTRGP